MKHLTFSAFTTLLEEVGRAFAQAIRHGSRRIAGMAWPQLAAVCIGLALLITIVPLAICLFVVFMAVKLAVAAIVVDSRRQRQ